MSEHESGSQMPGPSNEEAETQNAGVAGLEALASDEAHAVIFFESLGKFLDGDISGQTYDDLALALSAILPGESLAILTWACQPGAEPIEERITQLKVDRPTDLLLRRAAALFGPRLSKAYFSSDRPAPQRDDWLRVTRDVSRNLEEDEYSISMRIQKRNGESLTIEGDGNSMARFARQTLKTLVSIGDRDAFSEEDLERLSDEWARLWALIGEAENSGEQTDA